MRRRSPSRPATSSRSTGSTALQNYVPAFLWQERERFFYEGMRLEIGPCFADYAPPKFFSDATAANAGKAKLDAKGGLTDYAVGLPFAPDGIAKDDPQAGLHWLWNVQQRYQAAGFRGRFRVTDLVGRIGRAEPFVGEMFKLIVSHRADLPGPDYECDGRARQRMGRGWPLRNALLRAGVRVAPVPERREPDLGPPLRRPARLPAAVAARAAHERERVEGLYMPSFSVGVVQNASLPLGGGAGSAGGVAGAAAVGGDGGHDPDEAERLTKASSTGRTSTRRRSSASTTCSRRSTCATPCGRRRPTGTSGRGASRSRATAGTSAARS